MVVSLLACFYSCQEKKEILHVTLDQFDNMRNADFFIDSSLVVHNLRRIAFADKGGTVADKHTRNYYLNGGKLIWLSYNGVSSKADSVLCCLAQVDSMGFDSESFGYSKICKDLQRIRTLNFDSASNNINNVYARLDYCLTKAFLCYAEGQKFGFTNPYALFNRLDLRDSDSLHISYRSLYDIPTKRPDGNFLAEAFDAMHKDEKTISQYLKNIQPENPLYQLFLSKYRQAASAAERRLALCNMERSRWRHGDYPQMHNKYVVVNIPAQQLLAVNNDERQTMRVAIGALKTKTPLLTSRVKRMDFNPPWIIPKSIIRTSVRHHAGNSEYFESHGYSIKERKTGKIVDPTVATPEMLMSSDFLVMQRGGEGNALGRVIFRFDNDYSIYMHDTSSPGVFGRANRMVSHGCIRVEHPYELAVFMLNSRDDRLMSKMKEAMTMRINDNGDEPKRNINKSIRSKSIEPQVPLYITYYTLYPNEQGTLISYPDIYGFDNVLYKAISSFLK